MTKDRLGARVAQLVNDAYVWQSSGDPYPPASIRGLPTGDQVALARAAHRLVVACDDLDARAAARGAQQE